MPNVSLMRTSPENRTPEEQYTLAASYLLAARNE